MVFVLNGPPLHSHSSKLSAFAVSLSAIIILFSVANYAYKIEFRELWTLYYWEIIQKAPLNCQQKKTKLATLTISRCCSSLERISNGAIFHFSTVYVNRKLWNWDVSCVEVLTQNWVELFFSHTISRFCFFEKKKKGNHCMYSILCLDNA